MQSDAGSKIAIPGLPNLRDLGGWSAGEGRRVRRGMMYRSTVLDRLDAAGLEALDGLSLRTVIDLRTAAERIAAPDRVPLSAAAIVCDVLGDSPNAALRQGWRK